MPDYEKMYYRLFASVTKAVLTLQEAQRETAEEFATAGETEAKVLDDGEIKTVGEED